MPSMIVISFSCHNQAKASSFLVYRNLSTRSAASACLRRVCHFCHDDRDASLSVLLFLLVFSLVRPFVRAWLVVPSLVAARPQDQLLLLARPLRRLT